MDISKILSGETLALYREVSSKDCTQDRAHEIIRYVYNCHEDSIDRDDFSDEAWGTLLNESSRLWGDYEYWHTNDKF